MSIEYDRYCDISHLIGCDCEGFYQSPETYIASDTVLTPLGNVRYPCTAEYLLIVLRSSNKSSNSGSNFVAFT